MKQELGGGGGLEELQAAFKRRRVLALSALAIGSILTMVFTFVLAPKYRSSATILIEQQELPAELVRSTVTSYADQRVQVISQRVMTTQTLLELIREFELYPRERSRQSREEVIDRMRDDIDFRMISADVIDPRSGRPTAATIAFSVSYDGSTPDQSVRVANALSSLYLKENLEQRTRLAEEASTFLREEGDRLAKRIALLEGELAKFKEAHSGTLPEFSTLNMELLERTEQQLRELEARHMSLDQQRVYLEAQLATLSPVSAMFAESGERILSTPDRLKSLRSQLASAEARYSADHPDIARLKREIQGLEVSTASGNGANDIERQLVDARASLASARERYNPEHPDRVRLERTVAALEARLAATPAATASLREDADNPAYIQIKAQLEATRNDQRALIGQIAKLRDESTEYRRKISVSPQIEKEYRELSRDYDNARVKYQETRAKQMEAQTAQNLEIDRKGERFTMIEPPLTPEKPVSPNRRGLLVLGFLLSFGVAAGLVWLAEKNERAVRSPRELTQLLGVGPLAVVPRLVTEHETRRTVRHWRFAAAGGAFVMFAVMLATAHVFVRPLDLLWAAALRKLGV